MIVIKKGLTRVCYLIGEYAIKLPRINRWEWFLKGLLGNMQERHYSKLSDVFCPVVFCVWGGWLIVMRRATPMTDVQFEEIPLEFYTEHRHLQMTTEYKIDSFGWYKGRVVSVDYGTHPSLPILSHPAFIDKRNLALGGI